MSLHCPVRESTNFWSCSSLQTVKLCHCSVNSVYDIFLSFLMTVQQKNCTICFWFCDRRWKWNSLVLELMHIIITFLIKLDLSFSVATHIYSSYYIQTLFIMKFHTCSRRFQHYVSFFVTSMKAGRKQYMQVESMMLSRYFCLSLSCLTRNAGKSANKDHDDQITMIINYFMHIF